MNTTTQTNTEGFKFAIVRQDMLGERVISLTNDAVTFGSNERSAVMRDPDLCVRREKRGETTVAVLYRI